MRILTGRAGSGKTQRLFDEMIQNPQKKHILIVPELYSHEYERELARQTNNTGGQFCEVLTFRRAAHRVFAETGGLADTVLSPAGRLLVLFEAVRRSADALTVYQDVSRRPEMLRELLSVIDELKSGAVTGEQVLTVSEQVEGSLSAKLRDIGLIDTVYETLTGQELPDPRDELTRMLEKLPQSTLFDGVQVYFDSFAGFTMQEFRILSALLQKKVPVTVALTYDAAEPELFGTAQHTLHRLRAIAGRGGDSVRIQDCGACRMHKPEDLIALETELLRADRHSRISDRSSVFLHAASEPFCECEYTAAQIARTVRETQCRYRDIVVTARNFDVYAPVLELVFERYGIPVFLSEKHDILQKPVLSLVGAALRTVTGGWRYEDVFAYLKTGFANVTPDECDELENYVLFWRLRGEKAWRGPWVRSPEGFSGVITERGQAQLDRLNELRGRVTEPLLALSEDMEQAQNAVQYAQAVYSFLERIDAGSCIAARADAQEQAGSLQTAEEYRQLWEILVQAMEQLAWVQGEREMETGVFVTLFRLVLSEYDVGTIPISMDRVTCGPMERVCRTGTPHVFVLGANDGVLPSAGESGGMLTDADRDRLLACEIELTTSEERAAREQELIYRMLSAPKCSLHLSWLSGGGEEGRPSYLIERIRTCLSGVPETNEAALMGSYRLESERTRRELASLGAGGDRSPAAQAAYRAGIEHETPIRSNVRGPLRDRAVISELYGERVRLTASRVDQFYSCQYAYFLKYGLHAKERRRAAFDAPETGTFLHYVLEHTIREISAREGGAAGCSDADASQIARRWVKEYIDSMLGGLESHSARFRYLFRRLVRLLDEMLQNILEELRHSDFKPIDFELGVAARGGLPAVEVELDNGTLELAGKVDRVDGYIQGDKLYVRVMDYKSGTKAFDLSDLWYGLNMQLLIYLFTVQDNGLERYRRRISQSLNEIVPAGALYIPARAVVPDAERGETEDGVRALREKELRRSGLILNEPDVLEAMEHDIVKSGRFLPLTVRKGGVSSAALTSMEEMGKLAAHIRKTLADMGRQLLDGSTQAKPYRKGPKDNACTWCPYAQVCQFDAKLGDRARYLKKLSQQEFWEQMEG